jgi:probable biosynthetic protein (TIGR04099 family)
MAEQPSVPGTDPGGLNLAVSASAAAQLKSHQVRLGMPQLAINGLSETWLLKHCGATHWDELAVTFGVPPESMTDRQGNRLYPSFVALRLFGSPLSAFLESDLVHFSVIMHQVSPRRYLSKHIAQTASGTASITVEMLTTFLKRERVQDNSALVAGDLGTLNPLRFSATNIAQSDLVQLDQLIRSRTWTEYNGYKRDCDEAGFTYEYVPSPLSDFNGAGLLYFAHYQDIVERTEWEFHRQPDMLSASTTERQIFYFANLNPGDGVHARLIGYRVEGSELSYRTQLFRRSDGRLMAELFTRKQFRPGYPAFN